MKKLFILPIFSLLCFFCCTCSGNTLYNDSNKDISSPALDNSPLSEYRKISSKEAKSIMDNGNPFILLDVRTEDEFTEQHIDGALLIPDYEINSRAETELPDKNALILVYCRSGRRSASAAKELISMGYTNVFDFGGIIDWQYGTVSGQE